jgi:hypothetical protein
MKLFTGYQLLAPDLSEDIALRKSLEFETNDFLAARTKDVYVLNVGNMLNVMLEARQQQLKHLQTREQVNETRLETQTNLDYAASSPRRDSNSQALLPTLHNDTSYDHNPHVTKEDVDDYARLDIAIPTSSTAMLLVLTPQEERATSALTLRKTRSS